MSTDVKRLAGKLMRMKIFWKCAAIAIAVAVIGILTFSIARSINVKSRTIELGLKDIGELATQAGYYTNVQVIEDSQKIFGHKVPLTESKYIFSYNGVIKAGVDFEKIEVNVDERMKTVAITIPEIKITSNDVDPDSLEIYDEKKSIFTPLSVTDVNVSIMELKQEAEANAVENGIFESARENAEMLIGKFLSVQYDPSEYEYVFR
jgi:hypothetical protein